MTNRDYKSVKLLAILFFLCVCLGSCNNREEYNTENTLGIEEKTYEQTKEFNTSYQEYNGTWSEQGLGHDEIIENGGVEFYAKILNDNEIEGTLFVQQAISGRIAQIESITGRIENGVCHYEFEDDGWGNSGILLIEFRQNEIYIEVQNVTSDHEDTGIFGINGSFILMRSQETTNNTATQKTYLENCSFYDEVLRYMENERMITDISMVIDPLFYTDQVYYTEEDFRNEPPLIIYLAKNEIYARHGYIFKDYDLNNYFKGQIWYLPSLDANEFSDSVFNDFEIENLKLLVNLDTYKK